MEKFARYLTLVCLMAQCGVAGAQMYKWRDANGKMQYSDSPPPSNVKAEKLNIKNDPKPDPQAVQQDQGRLKNQELQLEGRLREKESARQDAERMKKAQEMRCTSARERLKSAENMRVYRTDAGMLDGNAEKQSAIAVAAAGVRASCN